MTEDLFSTEEVAQAAASSPPQASAEDDEAKKESFKLPKELPPVIRELFGNAPDSFKVPTFFASVTCLAAIATRLRAYYCFDSEPHAILLQTIISGEQSSGKSFARNNVERVIMSVLKKRDDDQRRQEQAYRELKQTASKTEKLPDPPKTVIRTCPISISIAQLIKRADAPMRYFGTPLTLWSFTDELAAATESNKRAFSNIKTIARTSYDLGSTYGVDYLSDNSYSATVDILQCSLYLSTPSALDQYADKGFIEGGGVTRTILIQLSDALGEAAPIFRMLTPKQRESIDKILEQMDRDVYNEDGTICEENYLDVRWLYPTVRSWCEEQTKLILRSGDRAHDTFYKRSSVSGFRIACLCYYLYQLGGMGTTKARKYCKQIYQFCTQYIFDNMMAKWAKRYRELTQARVQCEKQTRVSLYEQLTSPFTRDQLDELIKRLELTTESRFFLSRWKGRGWIKEIEPKTYQKVC